MAKDVASSGHLLGQLIGDWWERYVVLPMLQSVATELNMFADNRYIKRTCRSEKIHWTDYDGNTVDYDFVLEINGTPTKKGTPVAFMESFWRRGARHSKDKARDDTNKLLPMRETYPSARFLAIAASGEFTEPARDYVKSRGVSLFFVPKSKIVEAFSLSGFNIDYDDRATEETKNEIAKIFQNKLDPKTASEVALKLREAVGDGAFTGFIHTIVSSLSAQPVEIEIRQATLSEPAIFRSIEEAAEFLVTPSFTPTEVEAGYTYKVTYSDGSDFFREIPTLKALKQLNSQLLELLSHMSSVTEKPRLHI
uniref:Uncharacterized protein n=1 Tax=Paracoccus aminophilus JCM 7686 TaxID=1367847 RepID=E7BLE5_PARAH|nr:hypothetical protein [Paracoccus aminophilus]ADF47150.1 hypothetical protein [Paracoccus aminophilus JCM 7686]